MRSGCHGTYTAASVLRDLSDVLALVNPDTVYVTAPGDCHGDHDALGRFTTQAVAAKAGTVIIAQRSSSYGNYVVISHGVGNTTLYAHMSSIKVSVGTYVKQGQTIGITGSTGHSTGPHLHFEVVENNVRINPLSHGAAPKKGYLTGYTLSGTSVGK